MTIGTHHAVNVSIAPWTLGGVSLNVWTASINPDNFVSSPVAVTLRFKGPLARTNPAFSSSPFDTDTGTDSPVNGAMSRLPSPSVIMPSAGINSPLLTSMMSPEFRSSIGISSRPFESCE